MKLAGGLLLLLIVAAMIMPIAEAQSPQFVLRSNVAPMYIANQTIDVQVEGIYAVNNVPQPASLLYTLSVSSMNGTPIETGSTTQPNGLQFFYYFNGLRPGMYEFSAYFTVDGYTSSPIGLTFLVSPPPVPYTAYFLSNGVFYFRSNVDNLTGSPSMLYPFTVTIAYQYQGGGSQVIAVFNDTTNLTYTPENIGQTVVITVQDKWGWMNSNNMNIADMQFVGLPYTYTFAASPPQPFGAAWGYDIAGVLAFIALIGVLLVVFSRRSGR